MRDPYLFNDVDVMKNKLGIRDVAELNKAEANIVPGRLLTLGKFEEGKFDFEKLKAMHKHILGDIYEWAGEPRTINIEKPEPVLNGISVQYCGHESIEKEAKKVINEINKIDWKTLNLDQKAEEFSRLTAKLWQVHPFREGNTRTTISFMQALGKSKGIDIDKELLKHNAGYVRKSLVVASIGEYSDYSNLKNIMKDAMVQEEPVKEKEVKKKPIKKESQEIHKSDKSKDKSKDDDFMKEYLEKQRRRSLAKERQKDLGMER